MFFIKVLKRKVFWLSQISIFLPLEMTDIQTETSVWKILGHMVSSVGLYWEHNIQWEHTVGVVVVMVVLIVVLIIVLVSVLVCMFIFVFVFITVLISAICSFTMFFSSLTVFCYYLKLILLYWTFSNPYKYVECGSCQLWLYFEGLCSLCSYLEFLW